LNDCQVRSLGGTALWFSIDGVKSLAAGEQHEFILDLSVPESVGPGEYNAELFFECNELKNITGFVMEVIEEEISFSVIKIERVDDELMEIVYSLEERSGMDQDVGLQILLMDENNQKITEIKESVFISSSSKKEFNLSVPVDKSLEGQFKLLVNLNSDTYSAFIQEDFLLGDSTSISGLSIIDLQRNEEIISGIAVVLFLIFSVFMIKRISKHRKRYRGY
jgi:hypothetical protein